MMWSVVIKERKGQCSAGQITEEDSKYGELFSTFQPLRVPKLVWVTKLELLPIAQEIRLKYENFIRNSQNAVM
jgi:hypothetical protein